MKIVIGENLKTFRKLLGLSQSELAEKLNQAGAKEGLSVAYKTISKWENGNGYPETPMLVHIAKVLNTTIDFLLIGKDPRRELMLENEKLNGINRVFGEQISYIIKNNELHLRFFEAEEYSRIEFIVFMLIDGKNQEVSQDITDDVFFNEIIINIPEGANAFKLKCKLVDKPDRRSGMQILTPIYYLN